MDERRGSGVVEPVRPIAGSDARRRLAVLVALVGVAVAIALIKPWGVLPPPVAPPARSATPGATLAGSPAPVATPDSYAELVVTCGSPSGWRAATLQHWIGRAAAIRTWSAIEPARATSPLDPSIPFAPVATDLVTAIGYCAPRRPEETPLDAQPEFWALDGPAPRRVEPARLEPPDANVLGGLWLPPSGSEVRRAGSIGWAPGRYAMRIGFGATGRWLGVEIENIVPAGSAASPDVTSPAPAVPGATGLP
jgi:hypothetical protein